MTSLTLPLLGAALAALGWLARTTYEHHRSEVERRRNAELALLERQISELYGPLAALVVEGRQTFEDLLQELGRSAVFVDDRPLSTAELQTWLYWVEQDFLPRNAQIRELLVSKAHLLNGEEMPESHVQLLRHAQPWAIRHARWKVSQVPYNFQPSVNWPVSFERDIERTFKTLKARQARLLGLLRAGRRMDA